MNDVTPYQTMFQTIFQGEFDQPISWAFLAMFLQRTPIIDMGVQTTTVESFLNKKSVAPLVSQLFQALDEDTKFMTPGESGSNEYMFGLAEGKYNVSVGNTKKRVPGETYVVTEENKDEIIMLRAVYWINKLGKEAFYSVMRRLELLAIQSFMNGEMPIGDTWENQAKLVFPRAAELKNAPVSALWSNASTADPWLDYGNLQKEIIKQAGSVGGSVQWISPMSDVAYTNLMNIYTEQATGVDTGYSGTVKNTNLDRDIASMPSNLQFLIDGGMQYGGWIRSKFSSAPVHIFTYPVFIDDSNGDPVEIFGGNTVPLCAWNPNIFQSYFGSGRHWNHF
jgi:hypothetical protein